MSELGQNRKRTHGLRQPLSQLVDALHIPIAEKLSGLRQVRDAVGIDPMSRPQVKSAATGSSDITIRPRSFAVP
jgi:hypothetical protein